MYVCYGSLYDGAQSALRRVRIMCICYACIQYRIRRIVAYTILRIKARTLPATCVDSWSISRHAACDDDGGECIHRNLVRLLAAETQSRDDVRSDYRSF